MNYNLRFFTLLFCSIGSLLTAQNVQLKQVKIGKLQNLDYIGTGSKYHYYASDQQQIHRFEKQNITAFQTFPYKLDNKNEYVHAKHIVDDRLIIISKVSETVKTGNTSMINVYQFDASTGAKMKVVKTGGAVKETIYYSSAVDTAKKQIVITIGDSVVNLMDYDLKPVQFNKDDKYKTSSNFDLSKFIVELEQLLQSFSVKGMSGFSFTSSGPEKKTDSTSVKNFIMTYEKKENKEIKFFKKTIEKLSISTRKKDSKVQTIDFNLSSDKSIIDMSFIEDKDRQLILIGKYAVSSNKFAQYGMFSVKYNQSLEEISPLKYYDLVSASMDGETIPNQKFLGLFYTNMEYPKYTFNLEGDARIMIYQKEFNNIKDHIYMLKVESNGELIFNIIPNQIIVNKKSPYRTATFIPVLLKDKLFFIFYDNPVNLDLSMNDVNIAWCNADKKTSVLVYCYYDISKDEVRKKKIIAGNETFKTLPYLNEFSLYEDKESGKIICLVPGETKKNISKALYEFSLTN